jgi:hypothetical protein
MNYIENIMPTYRGSLMNFKVCPATNKIELFDCQKHFLKNLIDGKITDCPRNLGKTFVIKLYSDYLNYVVDMCKYDSNIIADDYIDGNEVVESGLLSYKHIKESLYRNQEKAMQEYNISKDDLKKYVIPKEDLEKFNLGK